MTKKLQEIDVIYKNLTNLSATSVLEDKALKSAIKIWIDQVTLIADLANQLKNKPYKQFIFNHYYLQLFPKCASLNDFLILISELNEEQQEKILSIASSIPLSKNASHAAHPFKDLLTLSSCTLAKWLKEPNAFSFINKVLLPKARKKLAQIYTQLVAEEADSLEKLFTLYVTIDTENIPSLVKGINVELIKTPKNFYQVATTLNCMLEMLKEYGKKINNFNMLKQCFIQLTSIERHEALNFIDLNSCLSSEEELNEFLLLIPELKKEEREAIMHTFIRKKKLSLLLDNCASKLHHWKQKIPSSVPILRSIILFESADDTNNPSHLLRSIELILTQIESWSRDKNFSEKELIDFFTRKEHHFPSELQDWIKEHFLICLSDNEPGYSTSNLYCP